VRSARQVPFPPPGPEGRRRRLLVLVICSVSLFMTYVDSTVLNVALPTIGRAFRADVASLQWVADAYLLVLATLLMLSGAVADRIGRRRVFTTGLLLFSLGSLLCSLAPGTGLLVAFRMLQALGGCMLTPVSLSIVRQVYTDPAERARALGIWSAVFGLGVASGPIIGGLLVAAVGWRSVFWVNVPVGVAAWAAARRFVPESKAPRPRRPDPVGQVLAMVLLGGLTFGLIEGPDSGWLHPAVLGALAAAGMALVGLVVVERRQLEPLVELRFFRSPPFSAANAVAVLGFLALSGFLFVTTLYLQEVRGDSALLAGVSLLPATTVIAASSPVAGRLVARLGPRLPLVLSGLGLAAGAALLLGLTPTTPYLQLAGAYVLLGLGFGLMNPPITNTAVSGMPPEQAGVASAIASSSRQVGNVLGVAVMGGLVSTAAFASGHLPVADRASFAAATHLAWWATVACGLAAAAIAGVCAGPWGQRRARAIYEDPPSPEPAGVTLGVGAEP
jgi:EmrB/QacA subfamily drug resistance transporter